IGAIAGVFIARQGQLETRQAQLVERQQELERVEAIDHRNRLRAELAPIESLLTGRALPTGFAEAAVVRCRAALAPYRAAEDPDWANGPLIHRLPADDQPAAQRDVALLLGALAHGLMRQAEREPNPARRTELLAEALRANEHAARA